ncbi:hypothetical protein Plhal304r1_c013g0049241 [Plasmopara halstedii]
MSKDKRPVVTFAIDYYRAVNVHGVHFRDVNGFKTRYIKPAVKVMATINSLISSLFDPALQRVSAAKVPRHFINVLPPRFFAAKSGDTGIFRP